MFTIWYTKEETWLTQRRSGIAYEFAGDECPYTVTTLAQTHVAVMSNVCTGNANPNGTEDLNHVYHDFQAENMHERVINDWGQWTRNKGAGHASMSVGDVIQDQTTNEYWVVAPVGFERLPVKEIA